MSVYSEAQLGDDEEWNPGLHRIAKLELPSAAAQQERHVHQLLRAVPRQTQTQGDCTLPDNTVAQFPFDALNFFLLVNLVTKCFILFFGSVRIRGARSKY